MNYKKHISPAKLITLGFLLVMLIGGSLLCLPLSSRAGNFTSPETAYFTAVSATCVTGLVIEDTATYWSAFGQIVILVMIQIGGLGFMSLAVMLAGFLKRGISPYESVIAAQSYGFSRSGESGEMLKWIAGGTFSLELLGALLLSIRFIPEYGVKSGIYRSVFLSVSAFCNAGFDVLGDRHGAFSSLFAYRTDPLVSLVIVFLILAGGIGFLVWRDLFARLKGKRIGSYTKMILIVSAVMVAGGAVFFAACEWNNPESLGSLDFPGKLIASLFLSVTPRTAGFAGVPFETLRHPSLILSILWMFVGGAAGSTAGGAKMGTVAVVLLSIASTLRGKKRTSLFRHTIRNENVLRAFTLVFLHVATIFAGSLLLSADPAAGSFSRALFEGTSAASTVGLSLGITPSLTLFSHLILMIMMIFGRIGILTISCSLSTKLSQKDNGIVYAETEILM